MEAETIENGEHSALRRALARPQFRRLLSAHTISRWGDTFNSVALVILVYRLTGSGVKVAGTVAFEIGPVLLFGFVAGSVVDRYPRRHIMIGADAARAVVALLLAAFHERLLVVYLAAFLLSASSVFFNPAAASVLPSLVENDEIVGANSAIWSAAVVSQIALAPAAGALVAVAGAGPAFTINAASFVVSGVLIASLTVPQRAPSPPSRHRDDIIEGLRVIRRSGLLSMLATVQGLAALSAGATSALLVVLAEDHLKVGASQFGMLIAAIGVGAGFAPLALQHVVDDVRRRRFLFGPYLLRGSVDLILAGTRNFGVALGALGLYGIGTSTGNITFNSALQASVPDRLRGRVFAFYDVVWQTARLASIGLGGVLADHMGIAVVYWMGGSLLVAASVLGFVACPEIRPVCDPSS